ncbi:hypothetical protein H257_01325 [Aphanomyces astaci]|uniref:Uncharacterized protein n=2 Tax=Aphanomyces astaci TaxID=112090 RepID=W4H9W8_APHAT|nr:hypothetical protein H257_01325 [Aphanomyces astaci]ETV87918.1 hypothetical protein H257_01325 [Aphanomyces astaci]RHY11940.1 hypothetical protein DYB25_006567 [Aphanomyces astaci]|eukprot:XP_009822781.1 hypothetical protein H257_01325 [Aphanomyces astaci]
MAIRQFASDDLLKHMSTQVVTASVAVPTSKVGEQTRYRLMYTDEKVKSRYDLVLRTTISLASHEKRSNSNTMLAQKAMKYRKLDQTKLAMTCNDPNVDVFQCMGIQWCKVERCT